MAIFWASMGFLMLSAASAAQRRFRRLTRR
jgi:hypothetical protein